MKRLDLTQPLDAWALSEGRRIALELKEKYPLGAGEKIVRIPLHWEVEAFGCVDSHYNGVVALTDDKWRATIATDPRLNATEPPQDGYAAATAGANGNSFSIALAGMDGATPTDYGPDAIEQHEVEVMCAFVAAVGIVYVIDVVGYDAAMKIHNVATHAEWAILMGYYPGDPKIDALPWSGPPYRWDLAALWPSSEGVPDKGEASVTASDLRGRIHQYKVALMADIAA